MILVNKSKLLLSGLALILAVNSASAQDSTLATSKDVEIPKGKKAKNKVNAQSPSWIFGIHGVVVHDNGEQFGNLFDISNSWHLLPYPTRISAEMSLNKAWRVEAAVAYSQYKAGKSVNEVPAEGTTPFVAFDVNAKYDLNDVFGETSVFDPYTVSGLGFTHRSAIEKKNTPTVNLGIGFNIWIYKAWGINLQTTAKFKLLPNTSNYLMHSAGLVYRLNYGENTEPKDGTIREAR